MKPSLGRIVLFRSHDSNGASEHPAMITRVWSDTTVNLTVFPDNSLPFAITSVGLNEDMKQGEQHRAWRWPPRVGELANTLDPTAKTSVPNPASTKK
jgi:hypothetical protein